MAEVVGQSQEQYVEHPLPSHQ